MSLGDDLVCKTEVLLTNRMMRGATSIKKGMTKINHRSIANYMGNVSKRNNIS